MTWADKLPMPTKNVWHYHVPRKCSCTDGLTPDENWTVMEDGPRADPPFPGEGWLVCGFCDGDGWYWWREEAPDTDVASIIAERDRALATIVTVGDLCNVWSIGNDGDVVRLADAIRDAIRENGDTDE